MGIIGKILILALLIVVIVFTVNNKQMIEVDIWPLQSVVMPLWLVAWLGIGSGLIFGYVGGWFSAGGTRRRARAAQRSLENNQRELAALRRRVEKFEAAEKESRIPLPPANPA